MHRSIIKHNSNLIILKIIIRLYPVTQDIDKPNKTHGVNNIAD